MIQGWEKKERVSELSMRFEVRGDLITEGGGGDHINQPGGGPSILKGQSSKQKSLISSPRLSKNVKTSERIFKLNSNSKSKFKVRVNSQDGSTESGGKCDWPGLSANRKPGSSRKRNYGL